MNAGEPTPSLASRILAGRDRGLALLAADGLLPLEPREIVPIQVALAGGADAEVAGRARRALAALDPRLTAALLGEDASPAVLAYFARSSLHPRVREAVLRRRDAPRELLVELAGELDPELQEVLLLRQDAIVEEPRILDALAANPRLTSFVRRRIGEYREHLLPEAAGETGVLPGPEPIEEATDEEVREAVAAAAREPAQGEVEPVTGLSEGQVRTLPVPVRLKLSRGAPRGLRGILLRDPNQQVALSALANNAFSDSEMELIAASRAVITEVLEWIAKQRQWNHKYSVVLALVRNPRSPIALAVRLVGQLGVRDLRALARDHNVTDAVRSTARRLYTIKGV